MLLSLGWASWLHEGGLCLTCVADDMSIDRTVIFVSVCQSVPRFKDRVDTIMIVINSMRLLLTCGVANAMPMEGYKKQLSGLNFSFNSSLLLILNIHVFWSESMAVRG